MEQLSFCGGHKWGVIGCVGAQRGDCWKFDASREVFGARGY